MYELKNALSGTTIHLGSVVAPADDLISVQSPEGDQIPVRNLGPGLVEEIGLNQKVRVNWLDVGFSVWMTPVDIRPLAPSTHLLSLYNRSWDGKMTLLSRKLVNQMGLLNNWTVELLPDAVVRAIRSDGQAWTFGYSWVQENINVWWPQPPRDEDAEAFVAAQLAVAKGGEI